MYLMRTDPTKWKYRELSRFVHIYTIIYVQLCITENSSDKIAYFDPVLYPVAICLEKKYLYSYNRYPSLT
jgi:hypothetical protein